jgi:type III secretory pathway component EscV
MSEVNEILKARQPYMAGSPRGGNAVETFTILAVASALVVALPALAVALIPAVALSAVRGDSRATGHRVVVVVVLLMLGAAAASVVGLLADPVRFIGS